jgi:NAD(P)H-quinone oxidoreductase subunit 5
VALEFGTNLLNFDPLAIIMIALVGFIGLTVASFAARYMKGDRQYRSFFVLLASLVAAIAVMVAANHLLLLLAAWGASNALLVRMMIHKASWPAARASGVLAGRTLLLGFVAIAGAFALLYAATGQTSISAIIHHPNASPLMLPALLLLLVGAMTQSALWPFHRWLTSSLNSPTPVSAIMHAGLVNGGGFLLARFAPLYLDRPALLTLVFALGLVTAFAGTLFKLMQNDVKRMLACSTMGQMGFMVAQTGLGLFPAAIAHLVWHGLFKAYLFLASGGAAQEKRLDLHYPPSALSFGGALLCGIVGSYGFSLASERVWLASDTTLLLVILAGIAGTQFALPMLRERVWTRLPMAVVATGAMGLAYGLSVHLIEAAVTPLGIMQPQPLHAIYLIGLLMLIAAWLGILFFRRPESVSAMPDWVLKLYVRSLNAGQPHPDTVTAHRNHYAYR